MYKTVLKMWAVDGFPEDFILLVWRPSTSPLGQGIDVYMFPNISN